VALVRPVGGLISGVEMSGFLDQNWFGGIKDFNKNIGMRDFLNNTDNAMGGLGITNWPNHFDDLYNSDRDVRSGTNLAALIYGGILAGGAMGAGSAGSGAGTGAGAGAAGGAGAGAGAGAAVAGGALYTPEENQALLFLPSFPS